MAAPAPSTTHDPECVLAAGCQCPWMATCDNCSCLCPEYANIRADERRRAADRLTAAYAADPHLTPQQALAAVLGGQQPTPAAG